MSTAGDVAGAAHAVISVEEGTKFYVEEDKAAIRKAYVNAQAAFVAASKTQGYEGAEVIIPEGADATAVIALTDQAKTEAKELMGSKSMIVLLCLIGFIASHAVGQGAVIWVYIAEIFPNDHRATGTALGSSTHWVCAAGLTFLFPIAMQHFEAGALFAFFCFCMILQLVWIKCQVIETKGITLEEIEKKLGIEQEKTV